MRQKRKRQKLHIILAPGRGALVFKSGGRCWFLRDGAIRREFAPQMHNIHMCPGRVERVMYDVYPFTLVQELSLEQERFHSVAEALVFAMDTDLSDTLRQELVEIFATGIQTRKVRRALGRYQPIIQTYRQFGESIPSEWMPE